MKPLSQTIADNEAAMEFYKVMTKHNLVEDLRTEADLCRNETADDIANLLDLAATEIEKMRNVFHEIKEEAWHELPTDNTSCTPAEHLAHTVYLMAMRGLGQ